MFGKKKYKHKKESIFEACGVDKKELNNKIDKLNVYIKKLMDENGEYNKSKVVEKMEGMFTQREMALLTFHTNYQLKAKKQSFDKSKHPEFM